MTRQQLFDQIKKKNSYLCIGLDTDITKLPSHLLKETDPIFEFNKQLIDATQHLCVAYKPNIAFYESLGSKGWSSLEKTLNYIPKDIFTIADAKRGDIGNTSNLYARTFFETYNFDSVTVSPYMGSDSVKPFLEYKNKWTILLAITSNEGAMDFQSSVLTSFGEDDSPQMLYQQVIEKSKQWGNADNMMYVVGATQSKTLQDIRKTIPDHFLLVPGIGAQGGNLEDVSKSGMNSQCGLLVNASRNIIYAGNESDFAKQAATEAEKLQKEMAEYLNRYL
jgi:orotidine-5'-phosphate decarboxylase